MAVDQAPIRIDPYTSTVPVPPVQMPQQDLQMQQPGAIYSKSGGIATMADSVMKGMLKGLQMKEEKKYKTAEAVMNAQDAAIGDAKKQYQDALMTKGKDDPETQAKWGAYTKTVNDAADVRQQYAVPEKAPKQPKGQKKSKTAADGAPAAGGFGAGIKQLLERNPHIVPELAIIGMKSQVDPKLYGQMTPEMTAQKTQMDAMQRQESNQKVVDAATAIRNKYAGKKDLTPEQQAEYDNAVAVLTPIAKPSAKTRVINEIGKPDIQHVIRDDEDIPPGYEVHEKPTAGSTPRVGSPEEITANYLSQHKIKPEDAPPELLKYLRDYATYKAAQTTSTSGEHMETDPTTGKLVAVKTYGSSTRGAGAPKPPTGFSPISENGLPQKESEKPTAKATGKGRMAAPPSAAAPAQAATGKGRMTPPPQSGVRDTGLRSMQGTQNTQKVETEEKAQYDKATGDYQRRLNLNRSKAADPASLEKLNAEAKAGYDAAKAQIVLWKAKQVKAIGGDPWMHQAKNDQGVTIGTMDGVNWVNVHTGYPIQEQ